jgi:hypothetical protein
MTQEGYLSCVKETGCEAGERYDGARTGSEYQVHLRTVIYFCGLS